MMKKLILLNSVAIIPLIWSSVGWTQVVPPSLVANANAAQVGTGAYSLVPTCGFGGDQAKTIDIAEDEDVSDARGAAKEAKERLAEAALNVKTAKLALAEKKSELKDALGGFAQRDSFIKNAEACQEVYETAKIGIDKDNLKAPADNAKIGQIRTEALSRKYRDEIDTASTSDYRAGGQNREACNSALSQPIGNHINEAELCGVATDPSTGPLATLPRNKVGSKDAVAACRAVAKGLLERSEAVKVAEGVLKSARKDVTKSASAAKATEARRKRELTKEAAEDKALEKEIGADKSDVTFTDSDLGVRGCTDGTCTGARVLIAGANAGSNSSDMFSKLGPYMLGATLFSTGIQAMVESNVARGNKQLGYTTGPNMWINPAQNLATGLMNYAQMGMTSQMMQQRQQAYYGYPLAAGNVAGAAIAGVGNGGIACSQLIGSPLYNNVGANGNILGPYAIIPAQNTQGVFNPLYNGQVGVIPTANGQMIVNQNGQLVAACQLSPCNIGGLGNTQIIGANGYPILAANNVGQGINYGMAACAANPLACANGANGANANIYNPNALNGGLYTTNPGLNNTGINGIGNLQYMDDLRRAQMAAQLGMQQVSLLNGSNAGYQNYGGGVNGVNPYSLTNYSQTNYLQPSYAQQPGVSGYFNVGVNLNPLGVSTPGYGTFANPLATGTNSVLLGR